MFTSLSNDELKCIIFNLDVENILRFGTVCKQLNTFHNCNYTIEILSLKLGMEPSSLHQLRLKYHQNAIIAILDRLAITYYCDRGFDTESFMNYNCNSEFILKACITDTLNNEGSAYVDHGCDIEHLTDISNIKIGHNIKISFNYSHLEHQSQVKLKYKTVILRFEDDQYWKEIPDYEWYNDPELKRHLLLPLMNTKPWIIIDEPFMQITLSSEIKGSSLILEDILFASRGLSNDMYRSVGELDGYRVLDYDDNTLIIEPNIDNFAY